MAEHIPAPIRVAAQARTVADTPVPVHLCWAPSQPCEVRIELFDRSSGRWQPWRLARDLLAVGMHMPAGAGDAHLEPFPGVPGCESDLLLTIGHPHSTPRRLHILIDGAEVSAFLADTYRQVRLGRETVEVPDTLELEGGEGRG